MVLDDTQRNCVNASYLTIGKTSSFRLPASAVLTFLGIRCRLKYRFGFKILTNGVKLMRRKTLNILDSDCLRKQNSVYFYVALTELEAGAYKTVSSVEKILWFYDVSPDENLSVCWQHVSADLLCQSPLLGAQLTFIDCCCLFGEGWGMGCALCPATDSGKHQGKQVKHPRPSALWVV